MDKSLLFLAVTGAGTLGAATYYYAAPVPPESETPDIELHDDKEQAITRLELLKLRDYYRKAGRKTELDILLSGAPYRNASDEVAIDIAYADEPILHISAKVRQAGPKRSLIAVRTSLPESRLTRSDKLRPGDVRAMAVITEILATDYIQFALTGRHLAPDEKRAKALWQRIGFPETEGPAFMKRFEAAMIASYQEETMHANKEADAAKEAEYIAEHGEAKAGWEAELAAERAREAVEDAYHHSEQGDAEAEMEAQYAREAADAAAAMARSGNYDE